MSHAVERYENGLAKLPAWFKQDVPNMEKIRDMKNRFRGARLHTVCESGHCPNMGKCWGQGVATFMILGNTCTRACRFCNITAGHGETVDEEEPVNVALNVQQLQLRYVVITSVARDDLPDQGSHHFAETIESIHRLCPETKVEVLIPDFGGRRDLLKNVTDAKPEVISHNIETVRRRSDYVRSKALYNRSLDVISMIKELNEAIFSKSSLMVGIGETDEEVIEAMQDLRNVDCDIFTIGQYLAPSQRKRHLDVTRYVSPEKYDEWAAIGREMGFKHVMAGPLVRSSYIAEEGYRECLGE